MTFRRGDLEVSGEGFGRFRDKEEEYPTDGKGSMRIVPPLTAVMLRQLQQRTQTPCVCLFADSSFRLPLLRIPFMVPGESVCGSASYADRLSEGAGLLYAVCSFEYIKWVPTVRLEDAGAN